MRFPTMWYFDMNILGCACAASKRCSVISLFSHRIAKWLAMALIRLHICAGWSEPLLVAHTTLLEISCHGSLFVLYSENSQLTRIHTVLHPDLTFTTYKELGIHLIVHVVLCVIKSCLLITFAKAWTKHMNHDL